MEVKFNAMVAALKKDGKQIQESLSPEKCDGIHMVMGIVGEASELLDAYKKYTIYNKPLDMENVIEELGDIEFFLEGFRQNLGITREETIEANMKKLAVRYSAGVYSDSDAQERKDKAFA